MTGVFIPALFSLFCFPIFLSLSMRNRKPYLTQELIIKLSVFLSYAAFSAWLSFFNLFLKKYLGFSDAQVGLISGVQQVNILLVLPVWGFLADRFGRKKMLLLAMMATLILFYGFLFQRLFLPVLFFTFLITLFYSPLSSLLDTIALDYHQQTGRSSYGNIRLWGSMGWAVASIAVGSFLVMDNIWLIFPIASLILLSAWLILRLAYKPLIIKDHLASLKMTHLGQLIVADKRLLVFLIIIALYGISSAPIQYYINMYYNEIGATYRHLGLAYAVQAMSELPFFFFGNAIVQKIGARRLMVITMLVTMLRMLAYSETSNPWIAIAIGSSHGICLALFMVSVVSYVHRFIPQEWRATGQSFIYACYFGAGLAMGNAWIGYISEKITVKKAMAVEAGLTLMLVIAVIAVFRYMNRNHRQVQEST